jgi:ubiquinone/menaquinone biosynthesis C-methylase UbiE
MFDDLKYRFLVHNEKKHYTKLLKEQGESEKIQKIEPNVDAFSYGYKIYRSYFLKHFPSYGKIEENIIKMAQTKSEKLQILSLGSGTGDWEINLLEKKPEKIHCELVDINADLLKKTEKYAKQNNLDIVINISDINEIKLEPDNYDIVLVRSSMHHFIELEHIMEQIKLSLHRNGNLIVLGEVIGQNGEKLYPETKQIAQKIFGILPEKYRLNRYTNKIDNEVPDTDLSEHSFECIRSEDIMPLLFKYFTPKEYVTIDAFLTLLLDFRYGPNYDLSNDLDRSLVETIANLDIYYISNNILKPTALFGIFENKSI